MNPLIIAAVFHDFLAAIPDITALGLQIEAGQSAAIAAIPRLIISARCKPLNGSSNVGTADISFALETHAGDAGSPGDHYLQLDTLRAILFGAESSPVVRANNAATLSASGVIEVDPRYVPMPETAMEHDGDRFRTVLHLRAGIFCPPIV